MKYPNGILKRKQSDINYANRGMSLEMDINTSNEYYLINDIAIVHKKPVSITINKVDYPSSKEKVIKEAYFKTPSTTDYNGLYKGKHLDFEAKETNSKTSFPLSNIHSHQLTHLYNVSRHQGIAFLIVRFNKMDRNYLIKADDILEYLKNENRKSLPLSLFEEKGTLIKYGFNPRLDYLKVIDNLFLGGKKNEKGN